MARRGNLILNSQFSINEVLPFKPIQIEDKSLITSYIFPSNHMNCDFAFANMCSWRFLYDSEYAIHDNFLFIRFNIHENDRKRLAYMYPIGNGNLQQAISHIANDAEALSHSLLILGVTSDEKKILNALFPNHFTYITTRDYFDYVYLREELTTLTGKKYQPKRNHINKFRKQYDYQYLPVTQEIIPECKKLEQVWYDANKDEDRNGNLAHERCSMRFAMDHFDALNLLGGAIVVDHTIIAFTYGSPINCKTFGVHVEKADIRYEGVFSVISQAFAKHIPQQYTYVNREEDLGIPGLRKSKLSYHPNLLLEKYAAVKI